MPTVACLDKPQYELLAGSPVTLMPTVACSVRVGPFRRVLVKCVMFWGFWTNLTSYKQGNEIGTGATAWDNPYTGRTYV